MGGCVEMLCHRWRNGGLEQAARGVGCLVALPETGWLSRAGEVGDVLILSSRLFRCCGKRVKKWIPFCKSAVNCQIIKWALMGLARIRQLAPSLFQMTPVSFLI